MISSKRPRSSSGNSKGVTLVELMVVLAVLSIIMGLVYSIFISQMQSSIWRGQLAERKQNIEGAMNVMLSDLIQAQSAYYNTSPFDTCQDGIAVSTADGKVAYWLGDDDSDGVANELLRYDSNSDQTTLIAEHVTALSFDCYNKDLSLMGTPLVANDVDEIRRVKIYVTGETAQAKPGTTEHSKQTLTASIELRNIPAYAGSGCGMVYFDISDNNVQFCNPPGETPRIDIYLCSLTGDAMGGQVTIFPREGLEDIINIDAIGSTDIQIVDGLAVMNIPEPPEDASCKDAGTGGAAYITAPNPAHQDLNPGTAVELLAVWDQNPAVNCRVSTARSMIIAEGDPYEFGLIDGEYLKVEAAGPVTACDPDAAVPSATLFANVTDACGHGIEGLTLDFGVFSNGIEVTGDPVWGNIVNATDEGQGTYSAIYNAGTKAQGVMLQAYSQDIADNGGPTPLVNGTLTLEPGEPDHLVGIVPPPVTNSLTVDNCIDNTAEVQFEIRDECGNKVTADETANLVAETSDPWALAHGGGILQPIQKISETTYVAIYNTATENCGAADAANITIDHTGIGSPGSDEMTVDLYLNKCDYPGLNINVTPLTLETCGDNNVEVTATVLADSNGVCVPDPTAATIFFEVKNDRVGANPDTPYGFVDTPNGRFLDVDLSVIEETATRSILTTTGGTAVANLVAWDSEPGDNLYVRATATIPDYGGAQYGPKEYANPILITNGSSEVEFYESDFSTIASFYDVPTLVPLMTGNMYVQVRDCDANTNPADATETVSATVSSDNVDFADSVPITLTETGTNTGLFSATVPMRRDDQPGILQVDKGAFITAEYTDADEPGDSSSDTIPLTGCREIVTVDASDTLKPNVTPDTLPYNTLDDTHSFRLIANVPTFANNGIINGSSGLFNFAQACSTVENNPGNLVALSEEIGDTGLLRIDGPSLGGPHGADYMFVGLDDNLDAVLDDPAPGGDNDLGVVVTGTPDTITIVSPTTSPDCDTTDNDVVNYGCVAELNVADIQAPVVNLGGDAGVLSPIEEPMQGNVPLTLEADDRHASGTEGIIDIATVELECVSGLCTPGQVFNIYSAAPNNSYWLATPSFDSADYLNGTYLIYGTATDDAGNTGESTKYTRTLENACEITGFELTRNGDNTITVDGAFLLNGEQADADIELTVLDGNSVSNVYNLATDPAGVFTWTSAAALDAPVDVRAIGTHGYCESPEVVDFETCEVEVTYQDFNYLNGLITVDWRYLLDSTEFVADRLFANATSGTDPRDDYNVYDASSASWTSTQDFSSDVSVTVGGEFGACVATQSFILNAPTCYVDIDSASFNEEGTVNVDWSYYLDGNPYTADTLDATVDDGVNSQSTSVASQQTYSWTTTQQFANQATVDVSGQYGICLATNSTTLDPPTCDVIINEANTKVNDDGTVYVEWQYRMNGFDHAADVMNATTSSAAELTNTVTVNNDPDGFYAWTSDEQYNSTVTVDVDGLYGVCYATNATTVEPPTCSIKVTSQSANPDGTVTVGWQYLMNGTPHIANTLDITASSATDPTDGDSTTEVSSYTWTSSVRYTSDVTVDINSQFGVCPASTSLTIAPPAPTCQINVTGSSYDVSDGSITVDWQFWLNGSPYVANTLSASADDGYVTDNTEQYEMSSYSWTTTGTAFTNDITVDLSGEYSTTCLATKTILVDAPACTVNITGSQYNINDGTVTADWQFLMDGAPNAADIMNATADDGDGHTDSYSAADADGIYSWTTGTAFTNDVTVEVGGNYGVCEAPKQSTTVAEPVCSVNITGSSANDDGTMNVDWEFFVDGNPTTADILNATADDGVDSDSTSQGSVQSYSWTTVQQFANPTTMEVGGHKGVCEAPKQSTVVNPPTCSINVTSQTANPDGTVSVSWEYLMNGLPTPHIANTLNIATSSSTDPSDGDSTTEVSSYSWTSSVRYTSDVTVDIDSQFGLCQATETLTITPPAPTCTINVTSQSYDVLNGELTIDWEYWLNGSAYIANTLTGSADDGYVTDSTTQNELSSYSWTTTGTAFTNDITVDLGGEYSTTCTATKTVVVDVPACTVNITGTQYNINDGTATVDWEFLLDGVTNEATIMNATADDGQGNTDSYSNPDADGVYSWTTGAAFTNDVSVEVGGHYGVCEAPKESTTILEPVCSVNITGASFNDEGTVNVDWEFFVDGSPTTADILNATADDGTDSDSTSQGSVQSYSWTTVQQFADPTTVEVGGHKGVCAAPKQSTLLTPPTCSVNIVDATIDDEGTVSVEWQYLMNGSPHAADILNATTSSGVEPDDFTTTGPDADGLYSWTSTEQYDNTTTVDVYGKYGVCENTASVVVDPPTCSINVLTKTVDGDKTINVEWEYVMNGSPHIANALSINAYNTVPESDSGGATEVTSYLWNSTTAFTDITTLDMSGQYGVCNATKTDSIDPGAVTCEIRVTSKSYDVSDGSITVDWGFWLSGAPFTPDELTASADDGYVTDSSGAITGVQSTSWTSSAAFTNDVTVDLTGTYPTCSATKTVYIDVPACTVNITGTQYNISDGTATVDWQFLMDGAPNAATIMNATADDGDGHTDSYSNPDADGIYSWTTGASFTNDVSVEVGGHYGVCEAPKKSTTILEPVCSVNITGASFNDEGTVNVDWEFFVDGSPTTADILNATADDGVDSDSTSQASVGSNSWTTVQQFANPTTVEVGGHKGVCESPKKSQGLTPPTCEVRITSATVNDEGTVNVDWEYLMNGSPHAADVLNATTSSGVEPDDTVSVISDGDGAYSWTSGEAYNNPITVDVDGLYGVCYNTDTTTVNPPTCSIENIVTSANADGTVNVSWDYYMNGSLHTADTLDVTVDSAADPQESDSATSASSHSFTSTTRYTSAVTGTITSKYALCEATAPVSITPPAPTCTINVTGSSYDISDGDVTVDWEFWLNGSLYIANTMIANATDGISSDNVTVNDASSYSWTTTGTSFTNSTANVTVNIDAQYSTTCPVSKTISIDVPACTTNITGEQYNISDGTATVDWEFLIDGVPSAADIMNATADDGDGHTDSYSNPDADGIYSWTTAASFTNDVSVEVGGHYGVCEASKDTTTIAEPVCSVNITSSSSNDDGTMNVDWEFFVDGNPTVADILNATADDGVDSDSTSQASVGSYSWTTVQQFANPTTMEVGGHKGVCEAPKENVVVNPPTCSINVTASSANPDGTVNVDWEYLLNGSPHIANTLDITVDSAADPAESDSNTEASSHSFTSSIRYTSLVTVDIASQFALCDASTSFTITPPAPTCQFNVTGQSYNVLDGKMTLDWEFWLNGSAYIANTMIANATDGTSSEDVTVNNASSYSWAPTASFRDGVADITVDLDGQYSTTCSASDTLVIDVPACEVNITGSSYDIFDGDVTVDWEFRMDGVLQAADILNATASDVPAGGSTTEVLTPDQSGTSYSWTTATAPWTNDVTVQVGGNYGVCEAAKKSTTIAEPTCTVNVTSKSYNNLDGSVIVDWEYLLDGAPQAADSLDATATNIYDALETQSTSQAGVQNYSWTTTQLYSDDVKVDVSGKYGVCSASSSFTLARPDCLSSGDFYDSLYTTPVKYYDVPLRSPAYVNGTAYMQVEDCDENEDRYAVDTVTVDLSSDYQYGLLDSIAGIVLTETGTNTGIFRGTATMTRDSAAVGPLYVYAGSYIDASYTDNDDVGDTGERIIPLTGVRELQFKSALGTNVYERLADVYPYDAGYPENDSAFKIVATVPVYAGDSVQNTLKVSTCSEDSHLVTLIEDVADNGILRIDTGTHPLDYVYVGADPAVANAPAPGADTSLGARMISDGYLYSYIPQTGPACVYDSTVSNYGQVRSTRVSLDEIELPLNSYDSHWLSSLQTSEHRGATYYARYFTFSLSAPTDVIISLASPGTVWDYEYDTYMYLLDNTRAVIAENGDPGSSDSRIVATLPAGDYTIEVTSETAYDWGDFTIALNAEPPFIPIAPSDPDPTVGTIDGTLNSIINPGNYSTYYSMNLPVAGNMIFSLEGGAFPYIGDPYLVLYDSNWNVIEENDNYSGTDSLIGPINLAAGGYIIEASSAWGEIGDYDLSIIPVPPAPVQEFQFDGGSLGLWTVDGLWHLTTRNSSTGLYSVHYGLEESDGNPLTNPNCVSGASCYDTGSPNSGSLLSPQINITPLGLVSFDYYQQTEDLTPYDSLTVEVCTDALCSLPTVVAGPLSDTSGFSSQYLDLSAYSGTGVWLRFTVDTIDSVDNDHEGVYVDNIQIY